MSTEHVVRGERLAEVNDRRGALVVVVVADLTLMVTLENQHRPVDPKFALRT
jgi:hypothetical protein